MCYRDVTRCIALIAMLILAAGCSEPLQPAATTPQTDGNTANETLAVAERAWKLVWSDEFDGKGIDRNKWEFQLGDGTTEGIPGWGNNELEMYREENASVENGKLVITAKQEQYGAFGYTSARLRTKSKGDWTYGRFEIKAKLPRGKGIWPAIWLFPTDNAYGTWSASGEIDIVELKGQDPATVYGTIHFGDVWPRNEHTGSTFTLANGNFADDFHVFNLEWDAEKISWFVDGVQYQTLSKWRSSGGAYPAPFDKRFHIILNLAVGGNFLGNPDDSTPFPQRLEVDYVRVYQTPM